MILRVLVGMLGLALAGCRAPGDAAAIPLGPQTGPVALAAVPPIRESINAGPRASGPGAAETAVSRLRPAPPAAPIAVASRLQSPPPAQPRTTEPAPPAEESAPLPVAVAAPVADAPQAEAPRPEPERDAPKGRDDVQPARMPDPPPVGPDAPADAAGTTASDQAPAAATPSEPPAASSEPPQAATGIVEPPAQGAADSKPPQVAEAPPAVPVDPQVQRASTEEVAEAKRPSAEDEAKLKLKAVPTNGQLLGFNVARVGDANITMHDLNVAYDDFVRDNVPPEQPINADLKNQIAAMVLDKLIQRTILVEEARRELKKKNKDHFAQFEKSVDDEWRAKELPPLLKKYKVSNEYELKVAMEKRGESLDHIREVYRLDKMAYEYLMIKLSPRFKSFLPAQRTFYHEHIKDFARPAQVAWREVLFAVDDKCDRVQARHKAEAALARLRRGEDFAKVAKALSQGATAEQGGLWETEPGSHKAGAVNDALARLPLNQVSPILDCPDGLRIVRIERRRAAGPAPFSEVQAKIQRVLMEENYEREVTAFVKKLRDQTVVRTIFDGTASAPPSTRRDGDGAAQP
jgi:parvulin-like peptidyl-prolyl isomerase